MVILEIDTVALFREFHSSLMKKDYLRSRERLAENPGGIVVSEMKARS